MPLVVGVDSSTSACKVQVRDADTGALVASGRAPHPATTPPRSEQHPRDWAEAFALACAEAGVPDPHRPAAIAERVKKIVVDPLHLHLHRIVDAEIHGGAFAQ